MDLKYIYLDIVFELLKSLIYIYLLDSMKYKFPLDRLDRKLNLTKKMPKE